jgi:ribosomal protein S18 acetylase RimI-like enzyme
LKKKGQIISMVAMSTQINDTGVPITSLDVICSHPERRIKGATRLLMQACIEEMKNAFGVKIFKLEVARGTLNSSAIKLYSSLGFVTIRGSDNMILQI